MLHINATYLAHFPFDWFLH